MGEYPLYPSSDQPEATEAQTVPQNAPQPPTPAHDLEELLAQVTPEEIAETRKELLDQIVEDKKRVTALTGVTEENPTAFEAAMRDVGDALTTLRQEIVVDDEAVAMSVIVRKRNARHIEAVESDSPDEPVESPKAEE